MVCSIVDDEVDELLLVDSVVLGLDVVVSLLLDDVVS